MAPSGRSINIMVHLDANGAPVQAAPPPPQHSFSVAPGGSGEVLRQGSGEPPRVRAVTTLAPSQRVLAVQASASALVQSLHHRLFGPSGLHASQHQAPATFSQQDPCSPGCMCRHAGWRPFQPRLLGGHRPADPAGLAVRAALQPPLRAHERAPGEPLLPMSERSRRFRPKRGIHAFTVSVVGLLSAVTHTSSTVQLAAPAGSAGLGTLTGAAAIAACWGQMMRQCMNVASRLGEVCLATLKSRISTPTAFML